jgi:hypothetical protein
MDTDGDGQFDVDEFIAAIVKVYHEELLNEDGSKHDAVAVADAGEEDAEATAAEAAEKQAAAEATAKAEEQAAAEDKAAEDEAKVMAAKAVEEAQFANAQAEVLAAEAQAAKEYAAAKAAEEAQFEKEQAEVLAAEAADAKRAALSSTQGGQGTELMDQKEDRDIDVPPPPVGLALESKAAGNGGGGGGGGGGARGAGRVGGAPPRNDATSVAEKVHEIYGRVYSQAVARAAGYCLQNGESLRGGWPVTSLNEYGIEQERIFLVTNSAIYRVKYDYKKASITRFKRISFDKLVQVYHGPLVIGYASPGRCAFKIVLSEQDGRSNWPEYWQREEGEPFCRVYVPMACRDHVLRDLAADIAGVIVTAKRASEFQSPEAPEGVGGEGKDGGAAGGAGEAGEAGAAGAARAIHFVHQGGAFAPLLNYFKFGFWNRKKKASAGDNGGDAAGDGGRGGATSEFEPASRAVARVERTESDEIIGVEGMEGDLGGNGGGGGGGGGGGEGKGAPEDRARRASEFEPRYYETDRAELDSL